MTTQFDNPLQLQVWNLNQHEKGRWLNWLFAAERNANAPVEHQIERPTVINEHLLNRS